MKYFISILIVITLILGGLTFLEGDGERQYEGDYNYVQNETEPHTDETSHDQDLDNNELTTTDETVATTVTGEVWADNWFALYADGELVAEDSVSITTERSFNSEKFTFSASPSTQLAFVVKDYKETDSGLEYIGTNRQQMGDGGFLAQFTRDGVLVGKTTSVVKCLVTHEAPLDKSCENSTNPETECQFEEIAEPEGWMLTEFDDSAWPHATVHTAAAVDPKIGYDDIDWDSSVDIIWGPDLETNNTLLCRMTLDA